MDEIKYYIIQTDDGDRYYYELYKDDKMIYIASSREEAEEYLKNA